MPLSFLPGDPRSYTIFPLDKGMIRNTPPQLIPAGGFYDLSGYIAKQRGLYRRPGFTTYAQGDSVPFRMVDMATLWKTNGTMSVVLITEDLCYKVSRLGGISGLYWLYTTGTVTSSGTNVTGSGMDWDDDGILAGDYLAFDSGAATTSIVEVSSVTGSGALALVTSLGNYTGVTYEIRRSLGSVRPKLADWTVHLNKLIIASYYQPPLVYDPATDDNYLAKFIEAGGLPATGEFNANAVASFADRVWFGGLDDGTDSERQQRIRWSENTDDDDFSVTTAYLDLPYSSGEIQRMVPLGRMLVVYLEDAIYFGTETGQPKLPVRFSRVETGRIGLIGPRAVCSFKNGHFFVGQDDVYYVSSSGIEPLNCPVLEETILQCSESWRIYAVADPKNTRIVFGFPTDNEFIEKVWSFDYRAKSWSYEEISTEMIASPQITETITWADLSGTTWDALGSTYGSWDDFRDEPSEVNFFAEQDSKLYQLSETRSNDSWGGVTVIPGLFETGDIDLGAPDEMKHFSRLSMRIHSDTALASALTFSVSISMDGGDSWKAIPDLVIYVGKEEGHTDFRAVGSAIRFKVSSSDAVVPYYIDSMVVKAAARGMEGSLATQKSVP